MKFKLKRLTGMMVSVVMAIVFMLIAAGAVRAYATGGNGGEVTDGESFKGALGGVPTGQLTGRVAFIQLH